MRELTRRIYLVRHGATDANLKRPYVLQGQRADRPLAELGRRQAQAAACVLADCEIAAVFSSPLRRARETAEFLAAPHQLTVRPVADLTECDVGRWEELSWEAIRKQDRDAWIAFDANPGTAPYAGGESFQQVQDRAVPAIYRLFQEQPSGNIVVVTHNVVARVILTHVIGLGINQARTIRVSNGGISIIAATGNELKLLTMNAVFHLDGMMVD